MTVDFLIPLLSCVVVFAVLYPLTRDPDAPPHGRLKLILTMPGVWLLANRLIGGSLADFIFLVFLFVAIIFLWAPFISHRYSVSFSRFLFSVPQKRGAFRPNYDEARFAASEGRLAEAISLIQDELDKSPDDFEGLMLLASGYQAMEEPERAMSIARRIQSNRMACLEQKEAANHLFTECLSLQHQLQLRGRSPKPIPES